MNKPTGYDEATAFTGEFKSVTPGGHICKILGAKSEQSKSGKEQLVIMFDIAEGPDKGFYMDQFKRKQESNADAKWQGLYRQLTEGDSTKFFKGMITAIEKSNDGYKWDWKEESLKGKLFGGVFGQEEYEKQDGSIGVSTKCRFIRSVEQIRKGVEAPEIKRLKLADNAFGGSVIPEEDVPWA